MPLPTKPQPTQIFGLCRAAGFLPLTLLLLLLAGRAAALELTLVDSFDTGFISPAAPRSLSVSTAESLFLIAFADGSIFEVRQDFGVLSQVLPPIEPPGRQLGQPGWYGLALVPPLNMFVSLEHSPVNSLDFYLRSGRFLAPMVPYGAAIFTGAFFEEKEGVGDLHAMIARSWIDVWTLEPRVLVGRHVAQIHVPREVSDRAENTRALYVTGLAYIAEADFYLLSIVTGELFAIRRGSHRFPDRPEYPYWDSDVLAETDLKPHGVKSVHDITWDPVAGLLYAVDSEQKMIFILEPAGKRPLFHRGDPDASGGADVGDVVFLLTYLFRGGASPGCLESADSNNDGHVDIADPIQLLFFFFRGTDPPPAPGPPSLPCGAEPDFWDNQVGLGCESYPGCH